MSAIESHTLYLYIIAHSELLQIPKLSSLRIPQQSRIRHYPTTLLWESFVEQFETADHLSILFFNEDKEIIMQHLCWQV